MALASQQPTAQAFGKYILLDRIATGGMAEIYKAKYRTEGDFEKTLCIKRILPHLSQDEEFLTMFRDEARLTVRLNHANIVQVFDFGRIGGDYFLAMEYVQGQNLRAVMKRCQELGATVPIPFVLFAVNEVCKGLNYAHTRKDENDQSLEVVHRDITPSNILVSYEGEVKIADFGIAKAAQRSGATQAGMIKGKASYLAPEQVAGQKVDARGDLFALGAVMWELLVGRKLFTGETDFEIMRKLAEAVVQPPSQVNAAVPPDLDRVVLKALARDPNQRYQSAAAMQKDLAGLMAKFAGTITTIDISNFLRRLFKKEVELEKEASKSFKLPPVVNSPDRIDSAASEGATLLGGERPRSKSKSMAAPPDVISQTNPAAQAEPRKSRFPLFLAAVALVGVLAVGIYAGMHWGLGPLVQLRPTPTAVLSTGTPAPSVTVAAQTATPAPTVTAMATATPVPTRVAARTPRPRPSSTAVALATHATPVPTPAAAGAFGILKLDSTPWGEIYVDGKDIGRQTPAFDLKLPEGRHEVRLVNPVQKLAASFTVFVNPHEPTKMAVTLNPM